VGVCVHGPGEAKPEPAGELLLGDGEPRGIDEERAPVAQLDQVRRVAEAIFKEVLEESRNVR